MKKLLYPLSLIFLFLILIFVMVPSGSVFGSHTDWLSQHVTLAETIRDACLEQRTLLPSWIRLGGGSSGYQFAYYGFLRPDILIGCLLPQVPMLKILICYMLAVYLTSALLCYVWLRSEHFSSFAALVGSVLFMTAGCLFHMHRQVMFVNYLPFLLLALLCVRKRRFRLLPACLSLICLSSFYFSISAFAAVGWYWYRREGRCFWKGSFLKKYIPSAALAAGISAALLLPTALVLLEHGRTGGSFTIWKLVELFAPNPVLNNLLFHEYGVGLTFLCLYAILGGLMRKEFRQDSILFLLFGLFGCFSWLLNGTLYARPKILIPFLPLIVLHCVRCFKETQGRLPLWPFAAIFPVALLWFRQPQFFWIIADACILFLYVLARRHSHPAPCLPLALLIAPIGLCLTTAGTENWVSQSETAAGFTSEELDAVHMEPLYHFDSMLEPLNSGNELPKNGVTRSTMYSSVTNQNYSDLYYSTLKTPIRINNRIALLSSENPFLQTLLGVRYLETSEDAVPAGYEVIFQSGDTVLAENKNVLPMAYFTGDTVPETQFQKLDSYEKLDLITRKTIVHDTDSASVTNRAPTEEATDTLSTLMRTYTPELSSGPLPDGLQIEKAGSTWEITADKTCTLDLMIHNPSPGDIVLLSFQIKSLTHSAAVIDMNGIRNKLSGTFAPYPNENSRFEYAFSSREEEGVSKISVTFSKGHYQISDPQWHRYSRSLLTSKNATPLTQTPKNDTPLEQTPKNDTPLTQTPSESVLSGTVTAENDGYLATSIPLQNGLEILVDGEPSRLVTVNEAFAGTPLTKGTHQIEIRFSPPGKEAGCIISIISAAGYVLYLILALRGRIDHGRKEFITYLITGGLTTAVNYVLFGGFLFLHVPYLAANCFAWIGAVLTAYTLNRRWVFHSDKHVKTEFLSFASLRFLTLLAENILLWLLISKVRILPLPAKLLVSAVTVTGNYILCKYGVFKKEV